MNARHLSQAVAELALAALSITALVSLERLFTDTSFLRPAIILIVISHLVAAATRRAGLGAPLSAVVGLVAFIVVFTAGLYPGTGTFLLPSSATLDALSADLADAWTIYTDRSAPVEAADGFIAVVATAGWVLAILSDWAAFRLESSFEAIMPATTVFVFGSLMGVDRHGVIIGAAFAAAIAATLIALRARRQILQESWVDGGGQRGMFTTLRVGGATAALAVLAGVAAGPILPGSQSEPLVDFRELTRGSDARTVVSPLVSISTSLVQQSNFEIFSVKVDKNERDYWRLMALNSFDGNVWRRSSTFSDIRGPVGSDVDPSIPRRELRQEITTRRLGNIYLPAAYEVSEVVDSGGIALEYEKATGALVVKSGDQREAAAGFTYSIVSSVPDFDPSDLPADATEGLDKDFVRENTSLPPACQIDESAAVDRCWPTAVTSLAQQITAGATTDHQRALLLQNHFLDPGQFTYDLDVALHENVSDIEGFLFVIRRGYCEQFASTFAAMARSLGIPARVAVGFTWGDWDEDRGEYVVRGRNAHAWPEVYFAGAGWVSFDPTPGRARPYDSDITGLQEAQFGLNDGFNRQTGNRQPITTTTQARSTGAGDESGSGLSGERTPTQPDPVEPAPNRPVEVNSGNLGMVARLAALLVIALLAAPSVRALRRRRLSRRVAESPRARAEMAFDRAIVSLVLAGVVYESHETPLEFESRIQREVTRSIPGVHELVRAVTVLRYGRPVEPETVASDAEAAFHEISHYCHSGASARLAATRFLDPRRVGPVS